MEGKKAVVLTMAMLLAVLTVSGCTNPEERVHCTIEDRHVDICYALYDPVCGYGAFPSVPRTYSNDCVACIDHSVEYYVRGECALT